MANSSLDRSIGCTDRILDKLERINQMLDIFALSRGITLKPLKEEIQEGVHVGILGQKSGEGIVAISQPLEEQNSPVSEVPVVTDEEVSEMQIHVKREGLLDNKFLISMGEKKIIDYMTSPVQLLDERFETPAESSFIGNHMAEMEMMAVAGLSANEEDLVTMEERLEIPRTSKEENSVVIEDGLAVDDVAEMETRVVSCRRNHGRSENFCIVDSSGTYKLADDRLSSFISGGLKFFNKQFNGPNKILEVAQIRERKNKGPHFFNLIHRVLVFSHSNLQTKKGASIIFSGTDEPPAKQPVTASEWPFDTGPPAEQMKCLIIRRGSRLTYKVEGTRSVEFRGCVTDSSTVCRQTDDYQRWIFLGLIARYSTSNPLKIINSWFSHWKKGNYKVRKLLFLAPKYLSNFLSDLKESTQLHNYAISGLSIHAHEVLDEMCGTKGDLINQVLCWICELIAVVAYQQVSQQLAKLAEKVSTDYIPDYKYEPKCVLAQTHKIGHGANIIAVVSLVLESTALTRFVTSVATLYALWAGWTSDLEDKMDNPTVGLFEAAVSTMAMLSTAYVLSLDMFRPVSDNADGNVEMSQLLDSGRELADRCNGNTEATTEAITVGTGSPFLVLVPIWDT